MQPSPVFLPGKFNGQRSLVGRSQWGRKESDTTEPGYTLSTQVLSISCIFKFFLIYACFPLECRPVPLSPS